MRELAPGTNAMAGAAEAGRKASREAGAQAGAQASGKASREVGAQAGAQAGALLDPPVTVLLMAGGQGTRMDASGEPTPKPLVPIRGIPLLERNLSALLAAGFPDIVVAAPAGIPAIGRFVEERARALALAWGARLRLLLETRPLGNIGAAFELQHLPGDVLVVYADNLTTLDLRALVAHHRRSGAALTSATHLEPFRIPFGEVEVIDDRILAYREKPEHRIRVSSGTFVLASSALRAAPAGTRMEVAQLVNLLIDSSLPVGSFAHEAAWIDVNDKAAVLRAEALVAAHLNAFEPWKRS